MYSTLYIYYVVYTSEVVCVESYMQRIYRFPALHKLGKFKILLRRKL
jgi:hypothetical protein